MFPRLLQAGNFFIPGVGGGTKVVRLPTKVARHPTFMGRHATFSPYGPEAVCEWQSCANQKGGGIYCEKLFESRDCVVSGNGMKRRGGTQAMRCDMMRFVTNNYNAGEVHGGINKVSLPMQNIPFVQRQNQVY